MPTTHSLNGGMTKHGVHSVIQSRKKLRCVGQAYNYSARRFRWRSPILLCLCLFFREDTGTVYDH